MSWGVANLSIAAGVAAMAAPVIMQPWAFYVASALGTMIADPDGMKASAERWRTTDHRNGVTAELDELNQQMSALKTQLHEKGKWEGGASEAFDNIHAGYMQSVSQLKGIRNATGDALDSTADFWNVATYFCCAIAGAMAGIALAKAMARGSLIGALPVEAASAAAGQGILTAVRGMMGKQLLVAGGLSYALYTAVQASEMSGKIFPTAKAMPTEMTTAGQMPFNGAQYDKTMGLTEKYDESLKNSPLGNMGGNGGVLPT